LAIFSKRIWTEGRSEQRMERVVIALGGNAIKEPKARGTAEEQRAAVEQSCVEIAEIVAAGYRVVLTHGNGPQVGNLLLQQEAAAELVPPMPLDICGAMTQGQIGYLIQQKLTEKLRAGGISIPVATVITQVLVDENDPAFQNPTKPIGPFYTEERARELMEHSYVMRRVADAERGWRRVVPSPDPKEIVELETIRALVAAGQIVISCGGGGIPVVRRGGRLQGVAAVIDKDLVSALLAKALGAEIFLNLTDVESVALNYGTPEQVDLRYLSLAEAKRYLAEGHFPPGSMGPKIEAAIRFLENGGRRTIITSLEQAHRALQGLVGTEITAG
jgi:carbamate kinase